MTIFLFSYVLYKEKHGLVATKQLPLAPLQSPGHLILPQCDVTRRQIKALVSVYIIAEVAYTYAQNAPFEWFASKPRLEVIPRLLSEICWLSIR